MVRFVLQGADGLPRKRKYIDQACERCRKKKKRCTHFEPTQSSEIPPLSSDVVAELREHHSRTNIQRKRIPLQLARNEIESNACAQNPAVHQIRSQTRKSDADESSERQSDSEIYSDAPRFVGDLSPEGTLLVATSLKGSNSALHDGRVGVWYSGNPNAQQRQLANLGFPKSGLQNLFYGNELVQRTLISYLQDHCLSCVPKTFQFQNLRTIYYDKIHPLLPIIPPNLLEASGVQTTLLKQALGLQDEVLKGSEFRKKLSTAMRTIVNFAIVEDKLTITRTCVLLSLFAQTADGGDTAGQLNGKAVHYTTTLGLHLGNTDIDQRYPSAETIFLCVWALDHLNASFYGKPLLIHERDCGRDMITGFDNQTPTFRLLLDIISLLNTTIAMYRPTGEIRGWEKDTFPEFESLIHDAEAANLHASKLATLEVLYHAVSILANRPESADSPGPIAMPTTRQRLSALRITDLVSQAFHSELSLFPFIPYALSLALSVAYRELQCSKLPTYKSQASNQLQLCTNLLRDLGRTFPTASLMAKLGRQVIDRNDNSSMSSVQRPSSSSRAVTQEGTQAWTGSMQGQTTEVYVRPTVDGSADAYAWRSPTRFPEPEESFFSQDMVDEYLGSQLNMGSVWLFDEVFQSHQQE